MDAGFGPVSYPVSASLDPELLTLSINEMSELITQGVADIISSSAYLACLSETIDLYRAMVLLEHLTRSRGEDVEDDMLLVMGSVKETRRAMMLISSSLDIEAEAALIAREASKFSTGVVFALEALEKVGRK